MKGRLTLQQRLALPIVLLGLIALLSNILAVFSINNVHANAGTIVDEYMVSEEHLEDIRQSVMNIHRLALSHIVAADHATMIRLVQEIKAEEAALDEKLSAYESFVSPGDEGSYQSLLSAYTDLKHGGGGPRKAHSGLHHFPHHQRLHPGCRYFPGSGCFSDHPQICAHPHSGRHGHPQGQL